VHDLDRILNRDDVLPAGPVDVVDDRGERRRLARAGGAGDEDEPAMLLGQAADAGRERQIGEVRDLARDDAERNRDRAALAEAVDAEAGETLRRIGTVELSRLEERLQPLRRLGADLLERQLSSVSPSSSARLPSRRTIGGRSTLRWMSLAPSSTARRSTSSRSIGFPPIGRLGRRL